MTKQNTTTTDIALSTQWAIGRFENLDEFFQAGRALGFCRFELNHGVDSAAQWMITKD